MINKNYWEEQKSKYANKKLELSDGTTINYIESPKIDPGKKTILYVHGLSSNLVSWLAVAEVLVDKFNLVALDMPGFGDSDRLEEYSIDILSSKVAEFVKNLDYSVDAIVSLCAGSNISLDMAIKEKVNVKNFFLFAIPEKYFSEHRLLKIMGKTGLFLFSNLNFLYKIWKNFLSLSASRYLITKYINVYDYKSLKYPDYGAEGAKKMDSKAWGAIAQEIQHYPFQNIQSLQAKTIIIHGDHDKISFMKKRRIKNKNVEKIVLEKVGHNPNIECPQDCAKIIEESIL